MDSPQDLTDVARLAGVTFDQLDALIRDAGYLSQADANERASNLIAEFARFYRLNSQLHAGIWRYAELLSLAERFAGECGLPTPKSPPPAALSITPRRTAPQV